MSQPKTAYSGLARQVHEALVAQGVETPMQVGFDFDRQLEISDAFRAIMQKLHLDLQDDSLRDTPARVAKMFCKEVFWGMDYGNFPKMTVIENKMGYDEMVHQTCSVMSMCEHHFVPFIGTAYVAYLPDTKVIGLSKINRLVDFFSRRPQVQERLTTQIVFALCHILETPNVACVVRAEHYCVKLRGVKDEQSHTVTSKMSGKFLSNPALRGEFLAFAKP